MVVGLAESTEQAEEAREREEAGEDDEVEREEGAGRVVQAAHEVRNDLHGERR